MWASTTSVYFQDNNISLKALDNEHNKALFKDNFISKHNQTIMTTNMTKKHRINRQKQQENTLSVGKKEQYLFYIIHEHYRVLLVIYK